MVTSDNNYKSLHVRTDGHLRPTLLGRLCRRDNLKKEETKLMSVTLSNLDRQTDLLVFHWPTFQYQTKRRAEKNMSEI